MFLSIVTFLLISSRNLAVVIDCPYSSLTSGLWRNDMLSFHNDHRRIAVEVNTPRAKQMNELAWNCETEYNLSKMQLELIGNNTIVYRNFGVNNGMEEHVGCSYDEMINMAADWAGNAGKFPSNLQYNGDLDILPAANMLKWNSTEMACAYRSFDSGDSMRLICAYNVRADVVGQPIFEPGNETCSDGAKCGDDGTCVNKLCRIRTPNPDVVLPIYTPQLTCFNSSLMNQFSRYYAVNMHNYYRRLIASGWAENKLTLFTPRAARMAALSYDCSLEETAAESAKKCESSFAGINKHSVDGGSNRAVIRQNNLSKQGALEQAISEWFSELQRFDVNPSSVLDANSTALNVTNIMHDKYKNVGCAVNNCVSKGFTIVECRYGPKILQDGDIIYDIGAPCSKCDKSEKCVFGVLCQL